MRPDAYHIRSPEALDSYVEERGNSAINNTKVDGGGKTLATIALVISSICVGMLAMLIAVGPQLIVAGGADARAIANQARTDARLALEQKNEDRTRMAVLEDRLNQRK